MRPKVTVVGSHPVDYEPGIKDRILEKLRRRSAYSLAIREAVHDQTTAGVELISDGQVRGDMIEIFASHLPGMTVEEGPAVVGRVEPPRFTPLVLDYREAVRASRGKAEVKAILTGPVTLCRALEVRTDLYPSNDHPSLLRDVARALAVEARMLQREGAEVLQVDEPILSSGVVPIEEVARYVNQVLKAFKGTTILHVCGDVTDVYLELEENINADVFDHEFAGHEENLRIVAQGDRPVGVGIVRSDVDRVETLDEVVKLLKRAREVLKDRIEFVDPDCGLRKLPRRVARKKLEIVRRARDEVYGSSTC